MSSFWWAICAALVWGGVPVLEKIGVSRMAPLVALFYRCVGVLIGLVLLGLFMVKPQEIRSVNVKAALIMVCSGFLASFIAQIFFYQGLKYGEVSRVVPVSGSYPLISFMLGIIVFGEVLNIPKVAGILLIMSGVWLLR